MTTRAGLHRMTPGRNGFILKGWHVLTMLLAFFGAVIAANAVFITLAVSTFPGEDVKRSYVQGLEYNKTLAARARQAALGWQAEASLVRDADGARVRLVMQDKSGAPLAGMAVSGVLRRAVTDKSDIALVFTEIAAGEFSAPAPNLGPGAWQVRGVSEGRGERFEFTGELSW